MKKKNGKYFFSLNISTFSHMKHENMGRKMKSVAKMGRKVGKSRKT